MQQEIAATSTLRPVQIIGVNGHGYETMYNAPGAFCDGRDLPFLEEGPNDGVWVAWGVNYRDVVVVDENNEVVAVYNLTGNSLGNASNYQALKNILLGAANAP